MITTITHPLKPYKHVLLVDDLRDFVEIPPDWIVLIARTSEEALTLLRINNSLSWYRIFLDHDLGGSDTTIPVVDYLSQRAFNGNPVLVEGIALQTSNPVGKRTIRTALTHYGYNVVEHTEEFTVSTPENLNEVLAEEED